ncbi:hypothetical protein IRT38_00875 (plasmid) [Acinetobacter sp. SK-43]|uniref:hypothetical protein n=1 Tax=Acinetobacter sp. SK-43 TaxID=2785295 RepID=UPI00188D2450|nr:hypothetical protein [Acinetobacter sp. SK-43]MBF4453969.1 hypothetical protein [Acinetobacter sp. SK-43]
MIQWVPIWFLVVTMNSASNSATTYEITFSTKQKCESELQKLTAQIKAKDTVISKSRTEIKCVQGEAPVYVPK